MTTFEALSLLGQFSLVLIGAITLVITFVVYLNKKK
ncbi:putative holin-like toxin [Bacillus suaedae]|nr:putative holin-like toxin [Bacillus suaedae]